ncbi:TetR/AcrR family transcriptional regulator [Nocardia sp. 004]|uniref:TetR/AcrR family transcriptional regulator n=1 Tax=Nocardia sp. 004 TaxID=3385978 RepID=UPI0039A0A21D
MAFRAAPDIAVAGRDTKIAIRDAAVRLFAAKGFEQTSLREVADAVGITKASLYYHYASKLDLLLAIMEPVVDHMRAVTADLERVPHDAEGIRRVLRTYLRGLLEHRDAGVLVMRDTVAIVNAMASRYPDMMGESRTLRQWLAGPNPTAADQLRACTALEVIGVALVSKELVPDADDALVESLLLDAATRVLTACVTA